MISAFKCSAVRANITYISNSVKRNADASLKQYFRDLKDKERFSTNGKLNVHYFKSTLEKIWPEELDSYCCILTRMC